MCDYSLQHLASRPAKLSDKLVTTRFKHSLTGGFCTIGEPNVAVCLMPGTEVAFEREIERLSPFWMRPKKTRVQGGALPSCEPGLPNHASRRARIAER